MRLCALACAADGILAEGITQKKPVTIGYGTQHGNEGAHRDELFVPVIGTYRVMKGMFSWSRADLGESGTVDISEQLATRRSRCCKACTETKRKKDENEK